MTRKASRHEGQGWRPPASSSDLVTEDTVANLKAEHGALMGCLARLQQGVGKQIAELARALRRAESETILLRGALIRQRTVTLWGIDSRPVDDPTTRHTRMPGEIREGSRRKATAPAPIERATPDAHKVICQTGCQGHGHPWLDDLGQCRRTGEACEGTSALIQAVDDSNRQ